MANKANRDVVSERDGHLSKYRAAKQTEKGEKKRERERAKHT